MGCTSIQLKEEAKETKAELAFQREQREIADTGYSELRAQYKRLLQRLEPLSDSALRELGFYRVKQGDTLGSIAKIHGITVAQLASWSLITDPVRVKAGDILVIREKKEEPNQPLQHNASTGSVSNFESPARRG